MGAILSSIGKIFGILMYFIYNTIGLENYALSLLFMTIAFKVFLLPLSIKQSKSTLKMQEMQPELQRIQERYKNDKEKLQEEQMKFYQEKKYNPSSGCLPMLIQFPIIIALFYVIRMPMSYMLDIPARAVGQMAIESVQSGYIEEDKLKSIELRDPKNEEITDAYLQETYQAFIKKDAYIEIKILEIINRNPKIVDDNPYLSQEHKDVLNKFDLKVFNIFNLGVKPTLEFEKIKEDPATYIPPLILILIAVATTYLTSSALMTQQSKQKDKSKNPANSGCAGKSMIWMGPVMTLFIGFQTPGGLAVYWTLNNILSFGQQKIINKYFNNEPKVQEEEEKESAKVNNKGRKNGR